MPAVVGNILMAFVPQKIYDFVDGVVVRKNEIKSVEVYRTHRQEDR